MRLSELPSELLIRPTPFLAIDVRTLESNIRAAQDYADRQGLQLRPHVKTHKIAEIAARQLEAGARGLTVSSLGEAERFAAKGFDDLFVAYSIPGTADTTSRISRLLERTRLTVAVDSVDGVKALLAAGLSDHAGLQVLVEVNAGLDRGGVTPCQAAEIAARAVEAGVDVAGAFTYPGHGYAADAAVNAAGDERRVLAETMDAYASRGLICRVRSGGSTPTLYATEGGGAVTEIRPGVYALNDAQQLALGTASSSEIALFAVSTVISVPGPDRFVLDAGSKCIASDRPSYVPGHGLVLDSEPRAIERIWEHHAVVPLEAPTASEPRIRVGDRVAVIPNHVCTALNLQREVFAYENGHAESWSVFAGQVNY